EVYANEPEDAWEGVTLLFENTAGQGTNLGYDLVHLKALFDTVEDPSRFGVCFDTCHAHAAGYDLTNPDKYEAFWEEFDRIVGLERLKAFHLNDSKFGLGSRKDRHEQIGAGEIGTSVFRSLMNDARFAAHPGALETPSLEDGSTSYSVNLEVLRGLRE
ncbi:MAG: deoxyribonuclease IV, partial [Myxococcota bacterium]